MSDYPKNAKGWGDTKLYRAEQRVIKAAKRWRRSYPNHKFNGDQYADHRLKLQLAVDDLINLGRTEE